MMDDKKFTVLIIDDTSANVLILKKTLMNAGYNIITADNGKNGRGLAEAMMPDIILLDIMMPEEDGFDTIKKLKMNPQTSSIPVIFLTAVSDVEAKVKGFELGAVDFITKPFHPSEIKARTGLHIKLSVATNALIERQKEKLKQIETAQQSMLVQSKDLPEAKFNVFYSYLQEAGGDFYDVIRISDNTFGYFIADVSGHDIPTGFLTASLKALLAQNCSPIYGSVETMKMINQVLLDVLPENKYLTACYLTIDRKARKCGCVNMGHPPLIYQPVDMPIQTFDSKSDVLGAFSEVFYCENEIEVNDGDRFFIYSDGLIEDSSMNRLWSNAMGLSVLFQAIEDTKKLSLDDAVFKINEHFCNSKLKVEDDILIMGIEV